MSLTSPTLGFIAIARPTFDVPLAETVAQQAFQHLAAAGYSLRGDASLRMDMEGLEAALAALESHPPDLLVIFQASFADSTLVMRIVEAVAAPLLLWAAPEARTGGRLRRNAFCGINLAAHALRRAGYSYEYLFTPADSPDALEKIAVLARAGQVAQRLRHSHIGRVGEHPSGFETCIPNSAALQAQLGVGIQQMALESVFAAAQAQHQGRVEQVAETLRGQLSNLDELDEEATHKTLATYLSLRDLATMQGVDAFALRCWAQFFTDFGCAACGAASLLNEQMIPASCEADVNGAVTQLILQWASGQPVFGTDLVDFDLEGNSVIVWHCGKAPLSMADPAYPLRGTIHSNRRLPLLMDFPLKPGRVTLLRLSEATGEFRLVLGGGEMLSAAPAYSGTSGTLRFDSGAEAVMDSLLREGLEHHISLVYGEHRPVLRALARFLRLPVLEL